MIHLHHRREIDRYFRGELEKEATARMLARLWDCPRCRARYDRNLLFEQVCPDAERGAADRLWRSIEESADAALKPVVAPAKVRWRRPLSALLLLGASAAAIMVLFARTTSEPVPRGRPGATAREPAVFLYRSTGGHKAEAITRRVRPDDGVLVAYSNPTTDLKYLLVFAANERGDVYWYYPAYEKVDDDPAAVPIRTQAQAVELGEEIRHELKPGPLRMFAVFLSRPWRVRDVEKIVRRELADHRGSVRQLARLPFNEGAQSSFLLEVVP